ncbi:cell division protein ZipA [Microbulbifer hydrolyticus]|uniref:Cell division protein ZipA n=1 Tax=Microbulbifer hydrolyticus TaxID=48074 RepID=A0A6P1TDN6_9GAMM|nr:cell division protein ZipA [Microbulbifer hydrolyticus]MBB5210726.1 cell division protein ZipA [Microbulbifer hydrolyticus]QHQ38822.1 cell division protein ZipA [Microbulbifer hydrolyticus]
MDNWLINLLALVLLAVVLDGARRAYLKHRETMKVSRNLSRSMRREMEERDQDILSTPREVRPSERNAAPSRKDRPAKSSPRKAAGLTESELEYIDPEEAEKRRQISAELPGSVRVVQRRKPEDASQVNRKVQQNFQSSRKPLAGSKPERRDGESFAADSERLLEQPQPAYTGIPEQVSLNLEEQVPMLMDSVADTPVEHAEEQSQTLGAAGSRAEAASDDDATSALAEPARHVADPLASLSEEPVASDRREPSLDESVSLESLQAVTDSDYDDGAGSEESIFPARSGWSAPDIKLPELKFPDLKKAVSSSRETRPVKDSGSKRGGEKGASARSASNASRKEHPVEEVLILNIMAPAGDCFEGNDLLRVLLSSGLRFGEMNIFHYHCGEAGEGPALFSLANIVVPGTFDMSEMEDFTTPGISLFLALPAEVEALKAFDTLLSTARNIAEQLGGELKDENRSVFTAQTAEHYRQRVMEFQRRKALARAQA